MLRYFKFKIFHLFPLCGSQLTTFAGYVWRVWFLFYFS